MSRRLWTAKIIRPLIYLQVVWLRFDLNKVAMTIFKDCLFVSVKIDRWRLTERKLHECVDGYTHHFVSQLSIFQDDCYLLLSFAAWATRVCMLRLLRRLSDIVVTFNDFLRKLNYKLFSAWILDWILFRISCKGCVLDVKFKNKEAWLSSIQE